MAPDVEQTTLRDLDDADARLQATVDLLKSTLVEPSLRPLDEDRKTLHYFVDEHGVEKLKADIRGFIDQTQVGWSSFMDARMSLLMSGCRKRIMNYWR